MRRHSDNADGARLDRLPPDPAVRLVAIEVKEKGIDRLHVEARQLAEGLGELRVGLLAEHDRAAMVGTDTKIVGQHLGASVSGPASWRGSVPRFVEQALRDHPGSTVQEILALAATDEERLIRLSSIRVELQNGRKQGRYESRDRRWSLAAPASAAAGEDGSSGAPPEEEPERDDAAGAPTGDAAGASAGEPAMQDPASPEAESEADGNGNSGRLGLTW